MALRSEPEARQEAIVCSGVRTHNLKNIDVRVALNKWTAVTGVSGSGKSSLVFDTLYAEAQRRFLETLGTYERQFLQGLPQGEFESMENVPAAVALKQTNRASDPRSLVGTAADLLDPLRTLFISLMDPSCVKCGSPVETHNPSELSEYICGAEGKAKGRSAGKLPEISYVLTVPFEWPPEAKKRIEIAKSLMLEGYFRVVNNTEILNLEDAIADGSLAKYTTNTQIVLDRVSSTTVPEELANRVETVWSQVRFSTRFSHIDVAELNDKRQVSRTHKTFRVQPYCDVCRSATTIIQSSDLDWQSVLGACSTCKGLGNIPIVDEHKVIPNSKLSLQDNAIKPWKSDTFEWMKDAILQAAKSNGIKTNVPYASLDDYAQKWIWTGLDPDKKYKKAKEGAVSINGFFETLESERYKQNSRILLAKYRKYVTCPQCEGKRLGRAGQNARCNGKAYYELLNQEIMDTLAWTRNLLEIPAHTKKIEALHEVYDEVARKVHLLNRLGLGSSTLSRRCRSLSGGEYQRVLLTRVLGNGLTDALYVLDEPSIGLGKAEIPELIQCLRELRDLGNTVVMVEHDPELVKAADEWLELGPGGGLLGGEVLARKGPLPVSLVPKTEWKIEGRKQKKASGNERTYAAESSLFLEDFSMLNCRNLNLEIPFGKLSVIAGPSGAGKSTLVHGGLEAALNHWIDLELSSSNNLDLDEFTGTWKSLDVPKGFLSRYQVVSVEQRAMHRTVTSVPATVLGLMDALRKSFAASYDAKEAGFTASDFSFNGAGGCETCGGKGIVKEDLFFLGEVDKTCPDCNGNRYRPDVLSVNWQGKNIAEWLGASMSECSVALKKIPAFAKSLQLAIRLGLGHLPLGVATTCISGGEAQRLRICASLSKSEQLLFCILDEPTRGLSERDIGELLETLLQLTTQGHTFVVVEHHEHFQRSAHQLVHLGPGGGVHGGKIVGRELRE